MKPIITRDTSQKNRLKLTGTLRWVHCDAGYLPVRGYYRLKPVSTGGLDHKGAWEQFWDVWEMHKPQLKREGLSVRKDKGTWCIFYRPLGEIKLDASITYQRLWEAAR